MLMFAVPAVAAAQGIAAGPSGSPASVRGEQVSVVRTPGESVAAMRVGNVSGTVKDTSDGVIPGAVITLAGEAPGNVQTAAADAGGSFTLPSLEPGTYKLTVSAPGFQPWITSAFVQPGQSVQLTDIAMKLSAVDTEIVVSASNQDVATAQLGFEEKQRVLGVFPNFYASYVWNAEPLSSRQKFSLAWRFSADPVAFAMAGVVAGSEHIQNTFPGYGRGALGYGKRFGATYADGFSSTMLGQAIFPAVFHQDPRYFVKGTGSVMSRTLYAIATTVICRGDNRRWQMNYSNILGNVASAGLSNAYYPPSSRNGAGLTVETALVTTAMGAVGGLIQEFFLHRMTPNIPDYGGVSRQ
ncbi:MAG: carboxypeptidase-like regulatory domain-containing protein [Janthinobacterium lividum]